MPYTGLSSWDYLNLLISSFYASQFTTVDTPSSKLAPPTNLEPYTMAVITEHGNSNRHNNNSDTNSKIGISKSDTDAAPHPQRQLSNALTIPEFFAHKNIFVTGGTGFLGTVLIEALLDTHPDIGTIYVLVRGKRNHDPKERINRLLQKPVSILEHRLISAPLSCPWRRFDTWLTHL